MSYLIYHNKRSISEIGSLKIYHDSFTSNQDPYIWNEKFLHSFCHITQLKNEVGQINFWVGGNTLPNFSELLCDCVFLVEEKIFWDDANSIGMENKIVDNDQCFEHHYKWVNGSEGQHKLKNKKRYTLKANPIKSFQPQDQNKNLIDILPFLNLHGLTTEKIINSMIMTSSGKQARNTKPFKLPNGLDNKLYDYLFEVASIKLTGKQLADKHPKALTLKGNQQPTNR
jgi:desulfoferrodoxin (superoxide reductase-like protein)